MQSYWLSKEERSSCILFLTGWGMDPAPFRSIPANNHDLLLVYDYCQNDPTSIIEQVEKYTSLHLAAWSMGVWIAGTFFTDYRDRFETTTAINGTLTPIDDKLGLPPQLFDDMILHFSPPVLEGFYREMFDPQDQAEHFLTIRPERSLVSIKTELQTLRQLYNEYGPGADIFSRKIVGTRDRIFQARAQLRSWGKENCTRIKNAHFPFYDWPSWDLVIDGGLPG